MKHKAQKMKLVLEKIRSIRINKGYSQEYIAEKLNISQAKYSRLENGTTEFTISILGELIPLLEIHPKEIVIFSDEIKKIMKEN